MSQPATRRAFQYGSASGGSTINQKAALASAYQELGKELASSKLKMVGNYTLQRPIGEGTFGKVRLGIHRLTNTRVAIKQIPKAHSASLTREIHHHRRLHHPNVMQLYEVIATEQYIWMVSELCAGGELYDYLVENQVLAEPEARRIFGQLCLAVAYVHSKGIVHRDLKLENILLDERCNVKLGDFGFTREFEAKRLMDTFCGTTGYASPEMLAGKKYTGEQVDIWSLGVILYALLCGALPFDDDDESVMKDKILRGDFEIPDCLSEEAQDLITSILQQDPTKRPSIHAILSHPWFTKTMVQSPMSTVEEDKNVTDYFGTKPVAQPAQESQASNVVSPTTLIDNNAAPSIAQLISQPSHPLATSASGTSEASFHSTRSDSESSGRRSINTDLTDPTTADSLSCADEAYDADDLPVATVDSPNTASLAAPAVPATTSSQSGKHSISLHRNESQTTIRRLGSNGSDASLGAVSKPLTRSTSTSLPTHHELPASSDQADDVLVPMYQSVPLSKRGSQSSSRGHHRTPSRTKRRSLPSGGLSDHHPPLLGRKPVDYVAQLAELQPATFSTAVEQNLLHQLSTLGIDVGQMVHSIVNDACDASGAMWWMLLRRAKDRQAEQLPTNSTATEAAYNTIDNTPVTSSSSQLEAVKDPKPPQGAISPPPVPFRDPARSTQDKSRFLEDARSSLTSSKSETSGLVDGTYSRLRTVLSHEQLDASSVQPLHASASDAGVSTSAITPETMLVAASDPASSPAAIGSTASPLTLQHDRSLASTPESSSSARPRSQHRHITAVASPSKLQQVTNSLVGSSPGSESAKSRRSSQMDRPRSNSLSVKQFAQSVLGTKDKGSSTSLQAPPEQVIVAGEVLPLERAKSPTLFSRRNTVSNVKDSMIGRLSNPSTPKKAAPETPDKPRKSTSKKSVENDVDRVKVLGRSADSASSSPVRPDSASQLGFSSASLVQTADKKDTTMLAASQDSFSTLSGTPQSSEKNGARGKSSSSFMATVRTWLGGAHDKPARKAKANKKNAAYRGLGIEDGAGVGKSPTGTVGKSGSVSTLAHGTPSRSPSMRRRSAHYQQLSATRRGGPRSPHLGSMSRRSSTGSSHHGNLDLPPNSFAQSMSRPGNMRRMSAGSITPTATVYGDYVNDVGGAAASSRPSRPSSSHSLAHSNTAPFSGLRGKAGSSGSTGSAYRPGQAGSTYSTGSGRRHPRPSHDSGTTVRRHRAYASSSGSPSRHNSFRHDSRPSSIKSRASSPGRAMTSLSEFGAEVDEDAGGPGARRSTRSTPRDSLDQRSISDARSLDPVNAQHHHVTAQSIFVAHKSRSPYRPPSANPHLHGNASRGLSQQVGKVSTGASDTSSVTPNALSGLPATGTGTWRHSWGRPPPCWAGPVDPPPINEVGSSFGAVNQAGTKPKLRDVFANRDDDNWTDEEDEPMYSGGLGQTGSLTSMSSRSGAATTSPYATRNFAAVGSGYSTQGSSLGADSVSSGMTGNYRGAASFSSRYAGVRHVFQQQAADFGHTGLGFRSNPVSLSLGNEFAPKVLSATLHSPTKSSSGPGAMGGGVEEVFAATPSLNSVNTVAAGASGSKTESTPVASQPPQQGGGGSRITASFHKPAQIIEEEEEDE